MSDHRPYIRMSNCIPGDTYTTTECDRSYRGRADEHGHVVMLPECEGCGSFADYPSRLCPGCEAYAEHYS